MKIMNREKIKNYTYKTIIVNFGKKKYIKLKPEGRLRTRYINFETKMIDGLLVQVPKHGFFYELPKKEKNTKIIIDSRLAGYLAASSDWGEFEEGDILIPGFPSTETKSETICNFLEIVPRKTH